MVQLSDSAITHRARLADMITEIVEADGRVRRCKRIDFADEGGVVLTVELVPARHAPIREAIARELEFAITHHLPMLPWARVEAV